MPLTAVIIERVFAAQDALVTALQEAAAFASIDVKRGTPVELPAEAVWVSASFDATPEPQASDLTFFDCPLELGIGISVAQYGGEDWDPVRARLEELVAGAEGVISTDYTIGGTCSIAWVSKMQVREVVGATDSQLRLSAALIITAQLYLS